MSLLELAIKSNIPVIRVTTTDVINAKAIIEFYAGNKQVVEHPPAALKASGYDVFCTFDPVEISGAMYESLVESQKSLILINQGEDSPFVFNAGEISVPKAMVESMLASALPKATVSKIISCVTGLTLKQISEVVRLSMAHAGGVTPQAIANMRSLLAGKVQGLALVDTDQDLYICPKELDSWLALNKKYFLECKDERLVPRGVLLNGVAGVGKSQGAKYIANNFGVPLYRLDLASSMSKYHSESEENLSKVLRVLDQEDRAVLLIDEVEKLFKQNDDEGITARMLSQLLWWLAEHKSRVLTVMTTNDIEVLPPELYRAGRIDVTMTLEALKSKDAQALGLAVLALYVPTIAAKQAQELQQRLNRASVGGKVLIPHALVVQIVKDLIKEKNWVSL